MDEEYIGALPDVFLHSDEEEDEFEGFGQDDLPLNALRQRQDDSDVDVDAASDSEISSGNEIEEEENDEIGFNGYKRKSFESILYEKETVNQNNASGHYLIKISSRKRVCKMCAKDKRKTPSGKSVETTFACSQCGVALCKSGCFPKWHGMS